MLEQQSTISPIGLAEGPWLVDPEAGRIAFAVKTLWGLADVKGTFDRFEGALHVTDIGTTGELVVHADSLDTKQKRRDAHLRSAAFFNSESHPRVRFVATVVTADRTSTNIAGDLIVGATRTHLDLPVEIVREESGAVTLNATATLPRKDVGLTWNKAGMIRGDVRLELELRLLAPGLA